MLFFQAPAAARLRSTIFALACLAGAAALPVPWSGAASAAEAESIELWTAGRDGYHGYRIPALIVTPQGVVLAFCEGRKKTLRDYGDIDLLVKRSTDGGRTWSPQRIVHEEGGDAPVAIGNPCCLVDAKTGTIWLAFCRDNKAVLVTSSRDDGLTWTPPRDITASVTRPAWSWVATGPGIGIQLVRGPHAGRLVIPSDHRIDRGGPQDLDKEWYSHMMLSDDGGESWRISEPIGAGGNECQVIERADGTLVVNARMGGGWQGRRGIATSADGGETWTKIVPEEQLPCPVCQAAVLRLRDGTVLISNPDPPPAADGRPSRARVNLRIRSSADEGRTWSPPRLVHEGPAGYSALAELGDGTLLCLHEGGRTDYREWIRLVRLSPPPRDGSAARGGAADSR